MTSRMRGLCNMLPFLSAHPAARQISLDTRIQALHGPDSHRGADMGRPTVRTRRCWFIDGNSTSNWSDFRNSGLGTGSRIRRHGRHLQSGRSSFDMSVLPILLGDRPKRSN